MLYTTAMTVVQTNKDLNLLVGWIVIYVTAMTASNEAKYIPVLSQVNPLQLNIPCNLDLYLSAYFCASI